jgi:hypothetical protein
MTISKLSTRDAKKTHPPLLLISIDEAGHATEAVERDRAGRRNETVI